ncbi:MAG: hypothetical protein SF070_04800 [Gemmatimonadota bacterium]|nr:hypothetical protein [Gemmatimonadota bacterium]
MSPVLRRGLAGLAGMAAAFIVILVVQQLNLVLHPLPPELDVKDKAALTAYARTLPLLAFLMVLLGYALGGAAGGFVAAKLGGARRSAIVVAVLLVIASIMNLSTIPHPAWFWVANLALVAVTPFLGARFGAEA